MLYMPYGSFKKKKKSVLHLNLFWINPHPDL